MRQTGPGAPRGASQQPVWPDAAAAAAVVEVLRSRPPLVLPTECDTLRAQLAAAGRGEAYVVQGGDCAERFEQAGADNIRRRVATLLQMALVLTFTAGVPVVRIGRMAGQFAKPRTRAVETHDGVTLPTYRGDMVNGLEPDPVVRTPDPHRMVRAYDASAITVNQMRALAQGGYADISRAAEWVQGFEPGPATRRYADLVSAIEAAVRFVAASGVADLAPLRGTEVFTSHEALVLDYERALVRTDERTGVAYAGSGHFLWVGERTRDPLGDHVALLASVANPVGVKIGPTASVDEVLALAEVLNPDAVPGRLTLIARMGAAAVADRVGELVPAVAAAGAVVTWICDPMHGNTIRAGGVKTRRMVDIVSESRTFCATMRAVGAVPAGVHVEITGDDVTECLGGARGVETEDLSDRYESACDPRLNHDQSLELAFVLADLLRDGCGAVPAG